MELEVETTTDVTDLDLVRRARTGDAHAFEALVGRHRTTITAYCARYHADPHDRDELVQIVLIRAWRGLAGFDGRSSVTTWLYRIVANAAATEHRRRGRLPVPGLPEHEPGPATPAVDDAVVLHLTLDAAYAELDGPFRVVGELADRFGCPQAEVARLTGVPQATVRTRLHRARRMLRQSLTDTAA